MGSGCTTATAGVNTTATAAPAGAAAAAAVAAPTPATVPAIATATATVRTSCMTDAAAVETSPLLDAYISVLRKRLAVATIGILATPAETSQSSPYNAQTLETLNPGPLTANPINGPNPTGP